MSWTCCWHVLMSARCCKFSKLTWMSMTRSNFSFWVMCPWHVLVTNHEWAWTCWQKNISLEKIFFWCIKDIINVVFICKVKIIRKNIHLTVLLINIKFFFKYRTTIKNSLYYIYIYFGVIFTFNVVDTNSSATWKICLCCQ